MRMPGMDGAELLGEVMRRYPHVVRIVLSGQADQAAILRSIGNTHQHLSKPCDPDTLKAALAQAYALQGLLSDDALKNLVSQLRTLPSPPTLYTELVQEAPTRASWSSPPACRRSSGACCGSRSPSSARCATWRPPGPCR